MNDRRVSQDYPGFPISRLFLLAFHFLHIVEHCLDREHKSPPKGNLPRSGHFTVGMNVGEPGFGKAMDPVQWEQEEVFFLLYFHEYTQSNNPGLLLRWL